MMLLTELPPNPETIFDGDDDGWVVALGSVKSSEDEEITFGQEDDQWMLDYC